MKKTILGALLVVLCVSVTDLFAEIKLPKIIGNNMVLQQGKSVPIWGFSEPNSKVSVKFDKQTKNATSDADGNWSVNLDALPVSKTPKSMTIQSGRNKVMLNNILVGEVWLASGQSNMEYTMKLRTNYKGPSKGEDYQKIEYENGRNPMIRILYVAKDLNTDELPTKGWEMLNSESLAPVSAPGYFFAKELCEKLDVPVGLISTSWGGTRIEVWTPEQAYMDSPVFKNDVKNHTLDNSPIGNRYEKMVKEMIPFAIQGFIWYQGESNLTEGDFIRYTEKQKVLVDSWRKLWADNNLPFYYVQISPHLYAKRRSDYVNTWEALPRFWEAQTLCMNIPNSGMVVTTDLVDNISDIHPSYKWEVGRRLALWALAKDYKKDLVYSGPQFKNKTIEGANIILEFDHVGAGLISKDDKPLNWFQIAGADGKFKAATATIEGDKVVVTSPQIKVPVDVRFAWDEEAMPNLFNKDGLPAVPFRTNGEKWNY